MNEADRRACDLRHAPLDNAVRQINDIHKLLVGNGDVGFFELVRRNTWWRKIQFWAIGVIFTALVAVGVKVWMDGTLGAAAQLLRAAAAAAQQGQGGTP